MTEMHEGVAPIRARDVSAGTNGCRMHAMVPYCQVCQRATLPSGPRQNEGHLAVRFSRDDQRNFSAFEGTAKLLRAVEIQAGPGGWVIEKVPAVPCDSCGTYGRIVQLRYSDDLRIVRSGGA